MAARTRELNRVERLLEDFARSKVGGWYFVNVAMRVDRVLLPLTGGRISSAPGQQILLLETVGAKSGERRRTPLVYVTDDDHVILIASKAGARRHPAWFHNLKANPDVRVLAPGRSGEYKAREARGEERGRLWAKACDYYAGYETYQDRAGSRRIPVVVLEPVR
jgi:deazaflavin-dependent oxidoreductase (nitroreductase family)